MARSVDSAEAQAWGDNEPAARADADAARAVDAPAPAVTPPRKRRRRWFPFGRRKSHRDGEDSEDEVEVDYQGEALEIGFNVSYLIDALSVLPAETASIYLTDASSSCLITAEDASNCQYVVMPMRL